MWTDSARAKYARPAKRYATDLTDAEFALIEPRAAAASAGSAGGARPTCGQCWRRSSTCCAPAASGACCPSASRPRARCSATSAAGGRTAPCSACTMACWSWHGRRPVARRSRPRRSSTASRSRPRESGGPRGYDAGKKINGRKRHVLVDTLGLLLRGIVHPAGVQDRDGLAPLLTRIRRRFPWLRPAVRRRRLPGRGRGRGRSPGAARAGHRQALRPRRRLRPPAAALGGRAQLRLVRPQPAAGQGRRDPDRQLHRHALPRRHPPAHPQARNPLIGREHLDGL